MGYDVFLNKLLYLEIIMIFAADIYVEIIEYHFKPVHTFWK